MYPKGEARESIQAVCALIVVEEAAAIPPSPTLVFRRLRRLPFPRPVKLNRGITIRREVTNMLNVGVILEVWVCMEFSCD